MLAEPNFYDKTDGDKSPTPAKPEHQTSPITAPPPYTSSISAIPQNLMHSGPLSLTLSKQIIYPTLPPARALYHLSLSLESTGHHITLSASIPARVNAEGRRLKARDRDLYIITRDVGFSIRSLSRTAYPGTGTLLFERHGFKGKWWELSYSGGAVGKRKRDIVLKKKDGKWTDSSGAVVAEEKEESVARNEPGEGEVPAAVNRTLTIAEGVDDRMKSLLVAVWCATVWYKQTYEELHGGLTKEDVLRRLNVGQQMLGGGGAIMKGFYAI